MSNRVYIAFPIAVLKNVTNDLSGCLYHAMCYCFYDRLIRVYGGDHSAHEQISKDFGLIVKRLNESFETGESVYNSIPAKSPKCSITKEMLLDFMNNKKTEFEVVCFLAFAAIRSILQRDNYKKITNDYLLGRMSGHSGKGSDISPDLKKYTTRYQLDKIKTELELNWGLKLYARQTRGFYVSFKMPMKDLIKQAELRRNKYKEKQLKKAKAELLNEVLEEIGSPKVAPVRQLKKMVI